MANLRLASPIQFDSIVDGPGVRCVLWTQGCIHNCVGCHNPQTHDVSGGTSVEAAVLINEIEQAKLQSGLSLSGGEPFLQSVALIPICEVAKKRGWNIWAYSGFTFEQLLENENAVKLLKHIDVLVDGKFEESKKDYRLKFKGSKNQRIIDVQASISKGTVCLSSYDDKNIELT